MEQAPDLSALVAVYSAVTQEIGYLREAEFRLVIAGLALDGTLGVALATAAGRVHVNLLVRVGVTCLSSLVIVALIGYLLRVHGYLLIQRRLRHRIETVFGVYNRGKWVAGERLFPDQWKDSQRLNFGFQFTGVVIPLSLGLLAFHGLFLYFAWTISV